MTNVISMSEWKAGRAGRYRMTDAGRARLMAGRMLVTGGRA